MRKKMWVYICDICGEMKPEETYCDEDVGICRDAPNGWRINVGAGKLCLCSTCYNNLVKMKNENKNDKKEEVHSCVPIFGSSA